MRTTAVVPALEGVPGFHKTVIAAKPDLVTGISIYEFGPFGGTPTLKQPAEVGAEVLVVGDVTGGGASTGIDPTCRYIEQLAALFGVGTGGPHWPSSKPRTAPRLGRMPAAPRCAH